ncbi:hypothetical protein TD95_001473 [Thielaviopsis punctulata]|uniref:Homeobox domain-containing protein n=1 Tax=Thielaviopsis punctulata TaxID=72032 RepID=A0A0F4ZIG5_9PEZI|nr:hypothetical protein TD95_001473 [Thielaviopsis punctulata]
MDNFLHWDSAAPMASTDFGEVSADPSSFLLSAQDIHNDPSHTMDLALENVIDDEFSFFALQHFSGDQTIPTVPAPLDPGSGLFCVDWLENPATPCFGCTNGGFMCKLIREGRYKGYCTSCVALGQSCSFAGLEAAADFTAGPLDTETLPLDPWPTAGPHPNLIMQEDLAESLQPATKPLVETQTECPDSAEGPQDDSKAGPSCPGKIGARFSRASLRILRQWFNSHSRHPYPSDEEKEMLQRQTGLNKTQITNWLANTRRRGKTQIPARSTSPYPLPWNTMEIPRRVTPATEAMNPLQRWANSPPENEPASPLAIARAVTASAASSTQASSYNYTDDGSGRSLHGSSASSVGTSRSSGGSFASAFSHASRGSVSSFSSMIRGRRRRRRRTAVVATEKNPLNNPLRTYQCTFCTEMFKTKHDWQRHEKSLHLSLERWVCSPEGTSAINPHTQAMSCVFCGEANPDDAHLETHNCSSCADKSLAERTFYRKDHLNQHLRLVHNVRFVDWSMKNWKVAAPTIRSRCGFCGIVMDTWSSRVEHLSEHFKSGASMADWKGDWGFDRSILDLVENSIPPYLIAIERNSPYPLAAEQAPPESPRNAYELIKDELVYFIANRHNDGTLLTDDQLRVEACRIIFASEVLSLQGISSMSSWLRDVLMSNEDLSHQAKFGPLRTQAECRLAILKINGKDNLFEACPLESALQDFVTSRSLLGLTPMDSELQEEACRIVGKVEEVSTHPSDVVANFLLRLIKSSTEWLAGFRQRAHLPRSEEIGDERYRSKDLSTIDSTIHSYSRLERELGDYLDQQRGLGAEPTDGDLQRQARIIVYEFDDGWNQTAADNADWLRAFRERHSSTFPQAAEASPSPGIVKGPLVDLACMSPERRTRIGTFLNDSNCFRRLEWELKRYINMCMSENNPNKHMPTDAELQHQARWVVYDDDDPWNQTAADNVEWLRRFKRDVGLLCDGGPGLSSADNGSWSVRQGGTGFAPPFAYPKNGFTEHVSSQQVVEIDVRGKKFDTEGGVASKYLESLTERYPRPATIFCSRELETGLIEYVSRAVALGSGFPSDAELRTEAQRILDTQPTAADDAVLLQQFCNMVRQRLASAGAAPPGQPQVQPHMQGPPQHAQAPVPVPVPVPVQSAVGPTGKNAESLLGGTGIGPTAHHDAGCGLGGFTAQEVEDLLGDISFDLVMDHHVEL